MYLKSLDIHGFKSFADKTRIEFHKGVTGIVGPNGCGKSNVVDAIRWVLGETSAKALRGGEMADVIFNGTEKRKPLGMAEVTMTMADCEAALKVDYNEVSLTRRVFRDGKSEYRINGTLCRLKDIHDLLMDTGIGRTAYSIMAQGQIDQILSSKPEERRAVFEEAAGITKYKREKKEALRKLEFTEANLLRVSDVLAEQERRMNSLKRQVAKARRYQALAGDVRVLDTHLAHKKFVEFTAERDELKTSIRSLEATESELERLMAPKEEAVADARFNARNFEGELADLRQQLNSHRNQLSAAQGRVAFNEERKAELEGRISQNREEIASTHEKLAQQEFDVVAANEALEQLARRIAEQEIQLGDHEERTRMARGEREQIEAQLREARAEANRAQTIIAAMQAKIESSLAQLETSRERARMLADEEQRLNLESEETSEMRNQIATELDEHSARTTELEEAFQRAERGYQHTRGDLDAARTAAAEAHKTLSQRASRLQVVKQLVASGEGFEKGTRKVLDGLDDAERFKPGIHGVLAGFIEADRACARAIETALGKNLQAVLVADEKLADAIISRLTEKRLGVAAILPETFVGYSTGTQMEAVPEGAIGWALDKVKSDPRVARVMERLLEKVLIVPNYATAMRLRGSLADVTMVTQAGELVGAEGVINGGDAGEGNVSVLELGNEVRDLEKEVDGLTEAEAAARQRVTDLEAGLAQLQEEMEVCRERIQRHKVELSTLQGQLTLAAREVESVQTKLDNVRWERGELDAREQAAHDSRSGLESELQMARERLEGHEEDQRRLQSQVEGSQRDEAEFAQALNELRTSLAVERQAKHAAEAQQQPMEARLSELRELSIRRETEIEAFVQRIDSAAAENARLAEEVETHQLEAEDLAVEIESRSARRNELIEAIDKAESELSEGRRKHAKAAEQRGREEVAITKIELRLESLVTTILERHQVELAAFEPDAHALLVCIASQKSQQARGGRQTFVESEDSEDEEPAIIVVDASKSSSEDELELPPMMTGEPDWHFVEAVVSDLKRRLDSMGPVNVDAIEEYEELEERYNEVRSNYDDLVSSKANLIEVIEKINEETQRRFSETFAQVKINFRDMFKELFGEKGQADLMLVDESDPLESGIEVIAKPPGKKLQSITLLSGGERSMTAVALLFSIYMIKPSPFCVLDELDAPLDESNINRFVKVLDRFIDNSQFIIVTHSKRTMARADVMYGVTMEEFGVSKPVGMRLTNSDDVASKGEAKTAAQKAALRLDA
ncbi:chromosome segregation protein SMC [Haloferula sp. BvORR071]|uniref:chromosome segregation protein SMC n=1 Tax=Haloferula sp. BvORR071 TaxID=1396141 RepID=UPI000695F8E9|nr:chromosome segregation protein SMC [Haloferula sp. BvORR071]